MGFKKNFYKVLSLCTGDIIFLCDQDDVWMENKVEAMYQKFEENKEAVYFSSKEELLEKCKYYLVHDSERKSIALAGRKRCITSGYSNEGMIRSAFKLIYNKKG